MQRSLPILMAIGIAALGATASAQTIRDNDKSTVVVDASRDMNQDNDRITATRTETSMSTKQRIEDSFQNNSKTTTNSNNSQDNDTTNKSSYKSSYRDDSTTLSNVGNGLAKPVATNVLEAKVSGNRVLNLAGTASTAANVRIDGSLNGFRGISSLNSNTGANSIQQSSVSIAAVTR